MTDVSVSLNNRLRCRETCNCLNSRAHTEFCFGILKISGDGVSSIRDSHNFGELPRQAELDHAREQFVGGGCQAVSCLRRVMLEVERKAAALPYGRINGGRCSVQ